LPAADAARRAILDGADPLLVLSYLVWPTAAIAEALETVAA
jgi:hypothetical protein